jgi:DNA modification methylase
MNTTDTVIRPGDLFALGNHRLICGDSKDPAIIKKLLNDDRIDLILSDPPYGVAVVEGKAGFTGGSPHKAIAGDHIQSNDEYLKFTSDWITAVKPYLARKNSIYIFNSDKMIWPLREGMLDSGCHFAQLLIWIKTQAVVGRLDYLPQHELIAYGWIGTHDFRKSKDKSVLVYPKPTKSRLHSTMKPVGLLRRIILNATKTGAMVFDGFSGSGSLALACQDTARVARMAEISPEYCKIIMERFERAYGITPERLDV